MDWVDRARARLGVPVDAASLVAFRVAFGLVVFWEMCRYYDRGWISRYWIEPAVTFPYTPFTFVQPWPWGWAMYAHVAVVALAALCIAVGLFYRAATVVLFAGFTWLFLIDQTRYLNHFYLISLLAFVMMWLPLHRVGSLDVRRGKAEPSETVPTWSLYWVRFMIGVPYFYGGLAKLTDDWIFGVRMHQRLQSSADHPFIGGFHDTDLALWTFVWGGLLFDLLVVPALLWSRTRVLALALSLLFHLSNATMFEIGIFPWMMMAVTLVFLPPDWPRRVVEDLRAVTPAALAFGVGALVGFIAGTELPEEASPVESVIGAIALAVVSWEAARYGWDRRRPVAEAVDAVPVGRAAFACGAAFVLVQLLLPLRHLLIPGDVDWTEEGHRWSWHMLLRSKKAERFVYIVDPPGDAPPFEVDPRDHLRRHQLRKVAGHPELNVLLARYLVEALDVPGAAVYVDSRMSLNGRRAVPMIDPTVDLTRVTVPWFSPAPWILPLEEPLPVVATRPLLER